MVDIRGSGERTATTAAGSLFAAVPDTRLRPSRPFAHVSGGSAPPSHPQKSTEHLVRLRVRCRGTEDLAWHDPQYLLPDVKVLR
jgi:hypothetical protein